ncbi:MAG TPA: ABC transporter ATP-binding protein, partial [Candidatus Saccharimonadales bacterium]|nr:ABC transporter ATP-binding protein [Candidatus Saccharimonadales bacterium]
FVVVIALLNQATPFLLKFIVDGIVSNLTGGSVAASYLMLLVVLIFASNLAITLLSNISGYIGDLLGARLNTLLSTRYYDHILGLPLDYYDNEITGRITSRLERSITTISQLITSFANNFIGFFLTSAITLVILAYYSWPIALLLGALFPFYIWLTTLSSKSWQAKQEGINQDIDYAGGRFIESVGAIRVVKSFVREAAESRLYAERRSSVERQTKVQSVQWHKYDVVRRLGLNLAFFFIYGFIVWQTFRGRFSLGDMTLLLQLTTQAQFPLFASSFIVEAIQRAAAGSKDFFEVMQTAASITDAPDASELKVRQGRVEIRDVKFSYGGGTTVLGGVSFAIAPGTKLALVGESGEGKTTISNLLLRLYQPSGGQILIDGVDITTVTQASLRRQIGVVFQEPALFSGTAAENICYGKPQASAQAMQAAAKAANAHDFISKLPQGYDTEIGERGVKLSGGQKQRIAIARAILKDAPILILDEATSSLDSKAEREVQEALAVLMAGRTTLIIAHRLSTIAGVDMVVGLRGGRVAEAGPPEQLAGGSGIYAELLQLQTPTKANKAKLKKYDLASV